MPVAAMLLAALFWSSSMIGNKVLVSHLAVSEVAAVRFVLGGLMLWALVLASGEWRHVRGAGRGPVLMGLLEPGMVALLVIWGQSYTSAINATVFWALMPLLMPILGRLVLKEPLRPIYLMAALVALAGTAVLVGSQNSHGTASPLGDALCLAGVLCACGNQLLARRVAQRRGRPMATSAIQVTTAGCLALLVMLLVERSAPVVHQQDAGINLLMLYMGLAGSAGPFLLYNYALRHMPVGRISLFPPLVAPLGAGLAALLLGESLVASDVIAIAVIMFAVFLPSVAERLPPPFGRHRQAASPEQPAPAQPPASTSST